MRNIVFFGNCQAGGYGGVYRKFIAPELGDTVTIIAVFQATSDEQKRKIKEADIIVSQLFDSAQQTNLSDFDTKAKIIEFPNLYLGFLWPHCGRSRRVSGPTAYTTSRYGIELGNSFLDSLIDDGHSPNDIVQRYFEADFSENLDRFMEVYIERQELRDEKTGFNTHTILSEFRNERLSFTPGHPKRRIAKYVMRELYTRLDVKSSLIDDALSKVIETPFPKFSRPIHPSVALHYHLSYGGVDELVEMDDGTLVSHESWVWNYAVGDDQRALHKAIEHSQLATNTGDRAAAIRELREAMLLHAPSPLAETTLGHQLIMQDDLVGALACFQRAALLDPKNPRCHHQLVYIYNKMGRTTEASYSQQRALSL